MFMKYFSSRRFIFFLLLLPSLISAEMIRLNGGQLMEGQIIDESEKTIIIKSKDGIFTIDKKDILEMERSNTKDKIAKVPRKKSSPVKVLLMSFIPGYSPLYQLSDHPEAGVPLSVLSFAYFYSYVQYQFNSHTVSFLDSAEIKNPGNFMLNSTFLPSTLTGIVPAGAEFYTTFYLKHDYYEKNKERIVNGQKMSEQTYLFNKNKNLQGYLTTSVVNAILSYYLLRKDGGIGTLYNTEFNGMKTAFYAIPTSDGALFGSITTF